MCGVMCKETHAAAEAVARSSRGKLVAYLAARWGDVAAAEDALSDAFAMALARWPREGCPENPEAWLLTVARRKLIDAARRQREDANTDALEMVAGAECSDLPDEIPDRRLALLFACAHPAIDEALHAPLMLQVVLGLEAEQVASAFLVSPAAMAQRLVRAKTKIRDAGIPFRVPERSELPERLEAVLGAIYACFSEGWTDACGADAARRELAGEAIYLGRLLAELMPDDPEVCGLLALMLYAEARRPARRSAEGRFIPLRMQDARLWDAAMITEAEGALRRASEARRIGRYQLEAAIQSAHIEGVRTGQVAWDAVVRLYDALVRVTASPVAQINRAVAIAERDGAAKGMEALESVGADARVNAYQPYWAARAYLLAQIGVREEARRAYEVAVGLERDPAVREHLLERCAELGG